MDQDPLDKVFLKEGQVIPEEDLDSELAAWLRKMPEKLRKHFQRRVTERIEREVKEALEKKASQ